MPTVPRVTRTVDLAPLPGARKSAAETPDSLGAGVDEAQIQKDQALSNVGNVIGRVGEQAYGQMQEDARKQADETARLNWMNPLYQFERDQVLDPVNGALSKKGEAAFQLPEQIDQKFQDLTGTIAQGLVGEKQRVAFQRDSQQFGQSIALTVRRHVAGEMQQFHAGELNALVENAKNAALANAQDPIRIGRELQTISDQVTTNGPALGMGPQEIQSSIANSTSAVHVGVIEQLLALDKAKAASVYFDETKSQIKGEAIANIEKALEVGTVRKDAQTQADTIIAGGGTLAEQREKGKAIDDPKVRDAVLQQIEHENAVNEKAERDASEALLQRSYDTVYQTHDVTKIPPADVAKLGAHLSPLVAFADRLSQGIKPETNLTTYYSLMDLAAGNPDAFKNFNLLTKRGQLDDGDFKHFANLQLSMRNSVPGAEKPLDAFRSRQQIISETLASSYGVKADKVKDLPALPELSRMLDTRVEQYADANNGKKADNVEVQRMLDDILSKSAGTPGSWWGLVPFNGVSLFGTKKRIVDLTPRDIPTADRTQIEDSLRYHGQPVTDQTVLNVYIESLSRKK